VTNNHVVAGTSELAVRFASGAVVQADVVGTAPNYDIGVIRLRNSSQLPPPVNIGPISRSANSPMRSAIRTALISH
jgi:2-alkenal reductase